MKLSTRDQYRTFKGKKNNQNKKIKKNDFLIFFFKKNKEKNDIINKDTRIETEDNQHISTLGMQS